MKLYISASLVNGPLNRDLATVLEKAGNIVFLPERFCPILPAHQSLSEDVFNECLQRMRDAEACVLALDCFERDSSWECGWFRAAGKPVVGYVEANLHILEDWMVKGGLTGVVTTSPRTVEPMRDDPILGSRPVRYAPTLAEVPALIEEIAMVGCK